MSEAGPGVMGVPPGDRQWQNVARRTPRHSCNSSVADAPTRAPAEAISKPDPRQPWWSTTSACARRGGGAVPRVEAAYEKTIDRDLFEHPSVRVRRGDAQRQLLVHPATTAKP